MASQRSGAGSNTAHSAIQVGDFNRVEETADPTQYLQWMQYQRGQGPDRALQILEVSETDSVLDIGCGPGADLRVLAATARLAVGVDLAETMTSAARTQADAACLAVSDARSLPFPDRVFDRCWARAVLIHTPRPQRAMNEIARVLKPGGKAIFSEPDHGSHLVAVDDPELFDRIKGHRWTKFQNPLIGRELPAMAVEAGLTVTDRWINPIIYSSFAIARAAGGPFDRAVSDAVADNAITAEEADRYLGSLENRDRSGAFFFAAFGVSISATTQ